MNVLSCSLSNFAVEHVLQGEICGILDGILIIQEILSHECRRIHHRGNEYPQIIECSSPASATFDILLCLVRTWSFTLFTNSAASLPMTKVSESAPS